MEKSDRIIRKPSDRIIRKPELLEITGVSHPTIWRWEKAGKFPKRLILGPNSSGWLESEVQGWIENKVLNREAS